jgi:hypothetical protein
MTGATGAAVIVTVAVLLRAPTAVVLPTNDAVKGFAAVTRSRAQTEEHETVVAAVIVTVEQATGTFMEEASVPKLNDTVPVTAALNSATRVIVSPSAALMAVAAVSVAVAEALAVRVARLVTILCAAVPVEVPKLAATVGVNTAVIVYVPAVPKKVATPVVHVTVLGPLTATLAHRVVEAPPAVGAAVKATLPTRGTPA